MTLRSFTRCPGDNLQERRSAAMSLFSAMTSRKSAESCASVSTLLISPTTERLSADVTFPSDRFILTSFSLLSVAQFPWPPWIFSVACTTGAWFNICRTSLRSLSFLLVTALFKLPQNRGSLTSAIS